MIQKDGLNINNIFLGDKVINYVYKGDQLIFPDVQQDLDWLTITSQSSQEGWITVYNDNNLPVNLEYSYDGTTWETLAFGDSNRYTFPGHSSIKFRGNNPQGLNHATTHIYFYSSVECSISGHLMTLINKNVETDTVPTDYCFRYLFNNMQCSYAHKLVLPKYLTPYCFNGLFSGDSYLRTIPDLSNCVMAEYSCSNMFASCTYLTSITIEDTQLAENCFYRMFYSCGNLTSAILKPKQLTNHCYDGMFGSCSKLSSIDCHALTNINTSSTNYWLSGVADNGTFTYHCDDGVWSSGDSGIPSTWTKIKAE